MAFINNRLSSSPTPTRKLQFDNSVVKKAKIDSVITDKTLHYTTVLTNHRTFPSDGRRQSLKYDHDKSGRPTLTISADPPSSPAEDSAYLYRGQSTTATTDSYFLHFDPKTNTCKLSVTSGAIAFNLIQAPTSPGRSSSADKYSQVRLPMFPKQPAPEQAQEKSDGSSGDSAGDWFANISTDPDSNDPYDFRRYFADSSSESPTTRSPSPNEPAKTEPREPAVRVVNGVTSSRPAPKPSTTTAPKSRTAPRETRLNPAPEPKPARARAPPKATPAKKEKPSFGASLQFDDVPASPLAEKKVPAKKAPASPAPQTIVIGDDGEDDDDDDGLLALVTAQLGENSKRDATRGNSTPVKSSKREDRPSKQEESQPETRDTGHVRQPSREQSPVALKRAPPKEEEDEIDLGTLEGGFIDDDEIGSPLGFTNFTPRNDEDLVIDFGTLAPPDSDNEDFVGLDDDEEMPAATAPPPVLVAEPKRTAAPVPAAQSYDEIVASLMESDDEDNDGEDDSEDDNEPEAVLQQPGLLDDAPFLETTLIEMPQVEESDESEEE